MRDALLTMCLIAKDEASRIDTCFESWWDDVDHVVLVDTGSTDDTIVRAQRFAKQRGQDAKLTISRFDWIDDFAAARQAADDLATTEWVTWCDLDDTVHGLGNLRRMLDTTSPDTVAFFCHYEYAKDQDGNTVSELWRERVCRRQAAKWSDRLHEHKLFTTGAIVRVDPQIAWWEHHPDPEAKHGPRNVRILETWDEHDPVSGRVLSSLGLEYMGMDRTQDSIDAFQRYLALPDQPADRRAQAARYLAVNLLLLNRPQEAYEVAWRSLTELWSWPDTHLSLAEACQTLGDPRRGYQHARQALEMGKPDTLLIVNPVQYTAHPRAVMAVCAAQMGMIDRALELAEEVLAISPSNQLVNANLLAWRSAQKREHTVNAYLELAQLSGEIDELLKAEQLLNAVPFFVTDHPKIIDARAKIAEQIANAPITYEPPPDSPAVKFLDRHADRITRVAPEGATAQHRLKAHRLVDVAKELQQVGKLEEVGVTDDRVIVGAATPLRRRRRGTVAVWTGYAIGPWHPFDITQRGLGGSETAAVRLAEELAAMNYAVTLYGQFGEDSVVGDVILRDFQAFDPTQRLDVMVGFRNAHRFDQPVNARSSILWLEDLPGAEGLNRTNNQHIDWIVGVTDWHRRAILDHYPWLEHGKVVAGRNGITHSFFETTPTPEREKRVLFTSSPDRGLDIVLECWPRVRDQVPDAEFVSTYSRWYDLVAEANPAAYQFREHIMSLLNQPGVTRIKGGLGQQRLADLMRSSLVWAHPSWYSDGNMQFHETSCISAMEAQAAGLVIVASNWGALTETVMHGTLIDGDPREKDGVWRDAFVNQIVKGLTDPDLQRTAQKVGPEMVRDMDWRGAAEQLATLFSRHHRKAA